MQVFEDRGGSPSISIQFLSPGPGAARSISGGPSFPASPRHGPPACKSITVPRRCNACAGHGNRGCICSLQHRMLSAAPMELSSKSRAATVMVTTICGAAVVGIITVGAEAAATVMVGGIIAIGGDVASGHFEEAASIGGLFFIFKAPCWVKFPPGVPREANSPCATDLKQITDCRSVFGDRIEIAHRCSSSGMSVGIVRAIGPTSARPDTYPIQPRLDIAACPHPPPGVLGFTLRIKVLSL
jgi:hypothetical protein